ncbi:hypothetical protein E2I00_016457 [Balaenoptera physalus]|uniref:Thioredoxin domain-containing protein n=1 Tax=Balaenoptera physalus TaxID=9770 RepID=A0A643C489_BALPH|nr:hypothetical protein E2I00_016457 [Balaenoptera physalus]
MRIESFQGARARERRRAHAHGPISLRGRKIPVAVLLLLLWGAPWTHGRRSDVRIITDENWRELLEGEWMIEFYAPWCPACQNLQPEWESFAEWGEDLEVNVAKVDVTEQPGTNIVAQVDIGQPSICICTKLQNKEHVVEVLCRVKVTFPVCESSKSLQLGFKFNPCKNGEFRRYQGSRTKKDFINFISEKEWKSIEPVSSWLGPGSVLMSSMSALFQLSMWIRTCHNYFIEDLGLPCMIFVADCLCPSKRRRPQPYPSKKLLLESSQPLKKVEEEQEADEEDVSEEEPESKERINTDSAQNAIRQRSVAPSLATDKSS